MIVYVSRLRNVVGEQTEQLELLAVISGILTAGTEHRVDFFMGVSGR